MKSFLRLVLFAAGLVLGSATVASAAAGALSATKKVLVFSKSSGYEHDAIKLVMKDGRPGYAFTGLKEIGAAHDIEFTFSKDGSLFTPDYLAQFDAYFFYTSGYLTDVGLDKNPALTLAGKAALLQAVAGGKGFFAMHSTTDSFHSPGNNEHGPARFVADGDKVDPFVRMMGAEFIRHEAQQPAHLIVADSKFPGLAAVPADFGPREEWYSLKNFTPDMHVLLVQDTATMTGPAYVRPPYPSTWARMEGRGRVFYTSMGHREDLWQSAVFRSVVVGGLDWMLRRVDADVTPNLATAAPQAGVLPVYVAPPPAAPPAVAPKKSAK